MATTAQREKTNRPAYPLYSQRTQYIYAYIPHFNTNVAMGVGLIDSQMHAKYFYKKMINYYFPLVLACKLGLLMVFPL